MDTIGVTPPGDTPITHSVSHREYPKGMQIGCTTNSPS